MKLQQAAELRVLDVASALSRGFMRLFANTWKNALAMQFVVILLSECLPATAQNTAELNTLRDVNKALWSCMKPPRIAYPGMQMTLRFSFDVAGRIQNKPRVTYFTPGTPEAVRTAYEDALRESLDHCTPLPFSHDLGAAIAGQPYTIRYIERRLPPNIVTEISPPVRL